MRALMNVLSIGQALDAVLAFHLSSKWMSSLIYHVRHEMKLCTSMKSCDRIDLELKQEKLLMKFMVYRGKKFKAIVFGKDVEDARKNAYNDEIFDEFDDPTVRLEEEIDEEIF